MSWLGNWIDSWLDAWLGDVPEEAPIPPDPTPDPEPVIVHVRGGGRFRGARPQMPWAWPFQQEKNPDPIFLKDVRHVSRILANASVESTHRRYVRRQRSSVDTGIFSVSGVRSARRMVKSTFSVSPEFASSFKVNKSYISLGRGQITVYSVKSTKVVDELWLLGELDDSEDALVLGVSGKG